MGYAKNPFNSPQGQSLLKDIFNLMFVSPENKPSQIESEDADRQISHYKGNIINIVNKMRKFVVGYQQVAISEAQSSGILVCPHCARRDAIWLWETVDAGHYSSPGEWTNSVQPREWSAGYTNERNKYLFVVRYRCNRVTTCNKCHITTTGEYSQCKACSSTDVVNVGCGEESFGSHYVREYTFRDNHPRNNVDATGAVNRNRSIHNGREIVTGSLSKYEFVHEMIPKGLVVKTAAQMEEYTPAVEFTYYNKPTGLSATRSYPISQLNYAISKQQMRVCYSGLDNGRGGTVHENHVVKLEKHGKPTDECPTCGATDYPPLFDKLNVYYRAHPMKIMNPQPLDASTGSGGTFKGLPVYTIYLQSSNNLEYKLLLPLPAYQSLRPIPQEPQLSNGPMSNTTTCPNDVGGDKAEEEAIKALNEKMLEEYEAKVKNDLDSSPDGETNRGFTYVVCEGRSRKAYYDESVAEWIDDSPPCYSYRDPNNGKTLTTVREYPRFTEIPSYSPLAPPNTEFSSYQGPNLATHLVQDCILPKTNQSLAVPMENSINYHSCVKIADRIDEELGIITKVIECHTCKDIVEAGGIIPYRMKFGQSDKDGNALSGFSQEVLNTEIAYENSYPTKDVYGNPVPTAWGLIADSEHDGKKMLYNPDMNIRIG